MSHLNGNERAEYVREMFARISTHYNRMNRLMTFGQDLHWRRSVIDMAKLPPTGGLLLDLGAGTGDLGGLAYQRDPARISIEVDFTFEMMQVGRELPNTQVLRWCQADAHNLPFPDNMFDAVVSGFLLRNLIDLPRALSEQYRVLKSGGRIVTLDTTKPQITIFTPLVRFYMRIILPFLGRVVTKQKDPYIYLPKSSECFLSANELANQMISAGFGVVGYEQKNFGTIAIHWGEKTI